MCQIHGTSFSCNTTKVIYVAEELGLDHEYYQIDIVKGVKKVSSTLPDPP